MRYKTSLIWVVLAGLFVCPMFQTAGNSLYGEEPTAFVKAEIGTVDFPGMYGKKDDGYKIPLVVELPTPALSVSGGVIESVTTAGGESLLPEDKWDQRAHFPEIGEDNKTVEFSIQIRNPEKEKELIKEIVGSLEYLTSEGTQTVDTGLIDFKEGTKIGEIGAAIGSIKPDDWNENQITLGLNVGQLPPDAILSFEFYSSDGQKLDVTKSGYEGFNDAYTIHFNIDGSWPEKGRIVLEITTNLKEHTIGFMVSNISLDGDSFEVAAVVEEAVEAEGVVAVDEGVVETEEAVEVEAIEPVDSAVTAQTSKETESNWNDFLHYTKIGRFELAKSYADKIIASQPDPTLLLDLAEANQEGYRLLLRMHADSDELREISGEILELIDEGRYIRRTDPKIIAQEIRRLSTTIQGQLAAQQRLKNAGDFAIPPMLAAIADSDRKDEMAYITDALPKIGRPAIRPLVAALQMEDVAVKVEVIRALGKIGYYEPLPYLKYIIETSDSDVLKKQAVNAIQQIDANAQDMSSAELFFRLAEKYYDQDDSLAAAAEYDFANVWFWDTGKRVLIRQEVDKDYFDELMTMRVCEWTLKADASVGKAIGLWIAAFFRAESVGEPMPEYFGEGHADAMTYATTAGAEYLHQALERALKDGDAYVALGVIESMAVNAGEKSLLYRLGTEQPLAKALSFPDRKVRYSAAIAFAEANPVNEFVGSDLIVENLAEAVLGQDAEDIDAEMAQTYALRAVRAMYKLALVRNKVANLSVALSALIKVTQKSDPQMQVLASQVLAHLQDPGAQRAITEMAMAQQNDNTVRIAAFGSLASSAKINANLLLTKQINAIYDLVSSTEIDPELRAAAAGAYGALNLPSEQVKTLILDQAKS
ncbi:MAG: HEAT repeat domain-containing protein [Planctomycetota bacterium]